MEKRLIEAVRTKALEDGAPNTKNGIATHVSEAADISISARTISNYLRSLENDEELTIAREIRESLSHYLGYSNYQHFKREMNKGKLREKRLLFVIFVLLIVIVVLLINCNKKECMIWGEDRYVKIHCNLPKAKPNDKKLFDEFRKLQPECDINFFFNRDGSARVFYYKISEGNLELFNMLTDHPVHGIPLKPITHHMIREHLCSEM